MRPKSLGGRGLITLGFDEIAHIVFAIVEDCVGYVILPLVEDLHTHVKHITKLGQVRFVALAVVLQVFDGLRAV